MWKQVVRNTTSKRFCQFLNFQQNKYFGPLCAKSLTFSKTWCWILYLVTSFHISVWPVFCSPSLVISPTVLTCNVGLLKVLICFYCDVWSLWTVPYQVLSAQQTRKSIWSKQMKLLRLQWSRLFSHVSSRQFSHAKDLTNSTPTTQLGTHFLNQHSAYYCFYSFYINLSTCAHVHTQKKAVIARWRILTTKQQFWKI